MPVVDVKNLEGKKVGEMELADVVFAATVNPHVLHEAVRWYLASQRAGTHKTKGRGEVAGSGRKLWRQKGTGRARVGSIRSSIWRKGGTVHGPQPRSYTYRLPRKVLLSGLRSALSAKLAAQKLTVVDAWALESHKTKAFQQALDRLDGDSHTILLVEAAVNRNLELASRNLEGVKLVSPKTLQPYDLLRHERLVLSRDAAVKLGTALAPRGEAISAKAEVAGTQPFEPAAPSAEAAPAKRPRARRKPASSKKAKKKD
jgi:large subunit ribosomal protein L4